MTRPALFAALGLVSLAAGGTAMATEQPKYDVVARFPEFEVRRYVPTIVASTVVEGEGDGASNEGFRRLAGYIFGGNKRRDSIAMTAPVGRAPAPQKIDMTAPVGRAPAGRPDAWEITFTMPSRWSMDALPVPNDPRVSLREVPARRVAVLRFSGFWSEENFRDHARRLEAAMTREGLVARGPASVARYDPPWTPWFLRTNEVQVEVD